MSNQAIPEVKPAYQSTETYTGLATQVVLALVAFHALSQTTGQELVTVISNCIVAVAAIAGFVSTHFNFSNGRISLKTAALEINKPTVVIPEGSKVQP